MKRLLLGVLLMLIAGTVLAQREDLQRAIDDINARLGINLQEGDYLWQGVTQNYDGNNLGCPYVENTQPGTYRATHLRIDLHFDQVYEWDYRISEDGSIFILCLPPDTEMPTIQTPTPSTCGLPAQLSIGITGQVPFNAIPSNLRDQPGQSGNLLAEIPPGDTFTVLDGPRCSAPSLTWWQVDYNGIIGWVAESGSGEYYLQLFTGETQPQVDVQAPQPTIAPVATVFSCPGAPTTRLSIGQRARVELGGLPNNMREGAGSSNAYVGEIPPGGEFTILDGPQCVSNMIWWQVDYNGLIGWTVEGADGEYWLEPLDANAPAPTPTIAQPIATPLPTETLSCPPAPPPRLIVDERGRVEADGFPNNVRESYGQSSTYLGEIPPGGEFTVLDGPICASGLFWWQVDYNGLIGWTAEGSEDDYWLEPLNLPTADITTVDCPADAPAARFALDERIRVYETTALYHDMSLSSALLGQMPNGGEFIVYEGPFCTSDAGQYWWKINYNGTIGFISDDWEAPNSAEVITENSVTFCADTLPPRLLMGGRGRYALPVMAGLLFPEPAGESIGEIPIGASFNVLNTEPRCVFDGIWWEIEYAGTRGWIAEVAGQSYRFEPLPSIPQPLFTAVELGDVTASNSTYVIRDVWLANDLTRIDYFSWVEVGYWNASDGHDPANDSFRYGAPGITPKDFEDVVRWNGTTVGVQFDDIRNPTQVSMQFIDNRQWLMLELPDSIPDEFTISPTDLTIVAINESNQLLQWDIQPYLASAQSTSSTTTVIVPIRSQVNAPHAEEITIIKFSDDGSHMMTQSADLVTVWDVRTWRPIALFPYEAGDNNRRVGVTELNQDGTLLAMTGLTSSPYPRLARSFIEIYDVQTGQLINQMSAEERGDFVLEDVVFTPDSQHVMVTGGAIAAALQGGAVWVWKIDGGQVVAHWYAHGVEDVGAIAITPDMRYMATTSAGVIKLWRLDY